ncbi:MAG: pantoate--beta-alanine ligase [Armatimonadota bacterium]
MRIAETIEEARSIVSRARTNGETIGMVPTMGAIHEGHLSLVQRAVNSDDFVVVSIFVNPTQFGPDEDYEEYPRQRQRDAQMLQAEGANLIFAPTPGEMYPPDFCTYVNVTGITEVLCGAHRPGHFRGVTTVVTKLFNIIQPDRAYFGRKDYQQYIVLRQMANDLNIPVEIIPCETVREPDGLAVSSRNQYLTPEQRRAAPTIYQALQKGAAVIEEGGSAEEAKETIADLIEQEPSLKVQYVEALDPTALKEPEHEGPPLLLAVAAFAGDTRLIDNIVIEG